MFENPYELVDAEYPDEKVARRLGRLGIDIEAMERVSSTPHIPFVYDDGFGQISNKIFVASPNIFNYGYNISYENSSVLNFKLMHFLNKEGLDMSNALFFANYRHSGKERKDYISFFSDDSSEILLAPERIYIFGKSAGIIYFADATDAIRFSEKGVHYPVGNLPSIHILNAGANSECCDIIGAVDVDAEGRIAVISLNSDDTVETELKVLVEKFNWDADEQDKPRRTYSAFWLG